MQDVTTLPFMRVVAHYGAPDYFFTEYFRVYPNSRLESHILASITENDTGRPVFAQLIGENIGEMTRIARELQGYPIAGIDLNMGCPAPKIFKKNVGGGMLRDLKQVDETLQALRQAIPERFTVKMRVGFEDKSLYQDLLECINRHRIDLLSVHGRTVRQMYRGEVDYEAIALARATVNCPVFANGNITSAGKAESVLEQTGCFGAMVGRSAIRNPWIFRQIRERAQGHPVVQPSLSQVRDYIDRLWSATAQGRLDDRRHVSYMKKFLNFVGQSVDSEGQFLHAMRRTQTPADLFAVCDTYLVKHGNAEKPFADEPYNGVIARPSREAEPQTCAL